MDMETGGEGLDFLRSPSNDPLEPTLYVAILLTVEERQRVLRGLSYARTRIREILRIKPLTPQERTQFREQLRELDRISSLLYQFPAYGTSKEALDHARNDLRPEDELSPGNSHLPQV